jgi:WD40 repeat protein
MLASGGYDKTLRLWDLDNYKECRPTLLMRTPVYQVAFTKDSKTLISRAFEHQVRLWDVTTWKEHAIAEGPSWGIGSFAYSPDGKTVAAPSFDRILLWEAATGKVLRSLDAAKWSVHRVAFSPNGKVLISGGSDGFVRVWDLETGNQKHSFEAGVGPDIDHLALASDGVTLALWGSDKPGNLELWHLGTGKKLHTLEVTSSQPQVRQTLQALCFAPDGKTLYAGSGTHLVVLRWDVATGKALSSFGPMDGGINGVAVARDGRCVAAVTMDDSLYLWETATGQPRLVVKGKARANAVAFSRDGRFVAVSNSTSWLLSGQKSKLQGFATREEVRLMDLADGEVFHRFRGHAGAIGELCFAPDGRTLASAGQDTTILLWDVTARRPPLPKNAPQLKPEDLAALWERLGGEAKAAHPAMNQLTSHATGATALLGEHLQPIAEADKEQMATLLKRLASEKFGEREQAMRDLKQLGDSAEPGLRQALVDSPPLEMQRRLQLLLDGLLQDRPRTVRAVEILERIGDKNARTLLARLAGGAAGAWLTGEARGSLRRLEQGDQRNP